MTLPVATEVGSAGRTQVGSAGRPQTVPPTHLGGCCGRNGNTSSSWGYGQRVDGEEGCYQRFTGPVDVLAAFEQQGVRNRLLSQ